MLTRPKSRFMPLLLLLSAGSVGCQSNSDADAHDGAAGGGRMRTPKGRLHADGNEIVDATGKPVTLRGVNLGSWLFVETWMDTIDYSTPGRLAVEGDRMGPLIASQVRAALQAAGPPQSTCGPGVCELDQTRADYYARVGTLLPSGANAADFALVQDAALACPEVADDSDVLLREALAARFGAAGRDRILDAYADAWITDADLEAIAERGLNLVRLPTTWRAWVAEDEPLEALVLRESTVERVNRVLDACEARGILAVIDLQESPGGHNTYSGPAQLYKDPAAQTATIELWRAIAQRFRTRDSVAAYSLLAEPFGAENVAEMVAMYDRLYKAIRADGDDHLLVIHDGFKGVDALPTPAEQGWNDVVYSTHYFEFSATNATQVDFASRIGEAQVHALQDRGDVPFFVGSFSSISDEDWAYSAFDLLTQRYADNGWSWSLWAWKRIDDPIERELFGTRTAWGVYRDFADSAPQPRIDVCHDDEAQVLEKISALRTDNLVVNPRLDERIRAAAAAP